jgi:hypothetical protein
MLRFHKVYFLFSLLLLIIEILIALFIRDNFIRPYVGDFLVVILLYCLVRSFFNIPVLSTAIGVLLFSFLIETAQYFQVANRLSLQENTIAKTIIGSSFEWIDLLAYTLGIAFVLLMESFNGYGHTVR